MENSETKKIVIEILRTENCRENCEKFAEAFFDAIQADDEPWSKVGYQMLSAFLNNDADDFCIAATGWSIENLLVKAGLIPDTERIFN